MPWCILDGLQIDEAVDIFYDLTTAAIRDCVPFYRPNCRFPVWYDRELITALREKERAFRCKKRDNSQSNIDLFRDKRSSFKNMSKQKFKDYINDVAENILINDKRFWSLVRARSRSHSLSPVITYGDLTAFEPEGKAELFNSYFNSVFIQSNYAFNPSTLHVPQFSDCVMSKLEINTEQIYKHLSKLDIKKSQGCDDLGNHVLCKCAHGFTIPAFKIFINSLAQCSFPNFWKFANIIPVHKSGSRELVANYRPVSLLPTLAKVFERLVCDSIYSHVSPLIAREQHGFIRHRSCTTNLAILLKNAYAAIDNKLQLDVIYTDYSKAFDKVDHALLIHKLHYFGINSSILAWLRSYLSNRKQHVILNDVTSSWSSVTSGVPQGSILGPLMFILYINDMPLSIPDQTLLFADDSKLFRQIKGVDDCHLLQCSLDKLVEWSSMWRLELNSKKCKILTITLKKKPIKFDYHVGSCKLDQVSYIKDLGVIIDSKLTFIHHIDSIVGKANRVV